MHDRFGEEIQAHTALYTFRPHNLNKSDLISFQWEDTVGSFNSCTLVIFQRTTYIRSRSYKGGNGSAEVGS